MSRYLHTLSAILFYILAGAFFLGYVLMINDIAPLRMAAFLYAGQLPLLFVSLLYGGLSVYHSLHREGTGASVLSILIGLPATVFFLIVLALRLKP